MERKMSIDDRVDAYRMRLEGASLQDVADRFGVSKQLIAQTLPLNQKAFSKAKNTKECIYPAIREYMEKNRCTYSRLAILCGMNYQSLYRGLTGKNELLKKNIDKLLDALEMTYEEAFCKEATEECTHTTTASSNASETVN